MESAAVRSELLTQGEPEIVRLRVAQHLLDDRVDHRWTLAGQELACGHRSDPGVAHRRPQLLRRGVRSDFHRLNVVPSRPHWLDSQLPGEKPTHTKNQAPQP